MACNDLGCEHLLDGKLVKTHSTSIRVSGRHMEGGSVGAGVERTVRSQLKVCFLVRVASRRFPHLPGDGIGHLET